MAQSNAALLLGRITGAEGPAHDLVALRGHMNRAIEYAEQINPTSRSQPMIQQILISWRFYELYKESSCDMVEEIASRLVDLTLPASDPNATLADQLALQQLQLFVERCPDS